MLLDSLIIHNFDLHSIASALESQSCLTKHSAMKTFFSICSGIAALFCLSLSFSYGQVEKSGSVRFQKARMRVETRPFASKDNCKVTLDVKSTYGDGTGYQLLLDADHTAYGDVIPETSSVLAEGDIPDGLYEGFEYTVPVGATSTVADLTSLRDGESASVEIRQAFTTIVLSTRHPWEG